MLRFLGGLFKLLNFLYILFKKNSRYVQSQRQQDFTELNIFQVSTKVTVTDILPTTKATFSFRIPDHKSGKVRELYGYFFFIRRKKS